jgi:Tol biopolymer transport system component
LGQEKQALIKLKLEDSKEITLATHRTILGAAISPNGSQIAYVHEENEGFILNIISSENGARSKTIVLEHSAIPNGRIHWTPDGGGISYLNQDEDADVPNIFIQPIDGSPPQQLTHFTTDMIGNYCWSMDGKQIAYSLGKKMSFDIVLIESLR